MNVPLTNSALEAKVVYSQIEVLMSKSRDLPTQLSLSFDALPDPVDQSTCRERPPVSNIVELCSARLSRTSPQPVRGVACEESKVLEVVLARARQLDW